MIFKFSHILFHDRLLMSGLPVSPVGQFIKGIFGSTKVSSYILLFGTQPTNLLCCHKASCSEFFFYCSFGARTLKMYLQYLTPCDTVRSTVDHKVPRKTKLATRNYAFLCRGQATFELG